MKNQMNDHGSDTPENRTSAVPFAGESRVHIGLAVSDVKRSTAFYRILLDDSPSKERPGYAKFEPREPSLNLSLNQADSPLEAGAHTHYGIQVQSTDAVAAAIKRLHTAGLNPRIQELTTCCYAVQNKAWVSDPDGNEWEIFVVLEADADQREDTESECCVPTGEAAGVSSCC